MNQVKKIFFIFLFASRMYFIEYDEEFFDKMPSNTTVMIGKHAQFVCKQKSGSIKW